MNRPVLSVHPPPHRATLMDKDAIKDPHLRNLHEDSRLAETLIYLLKNGVTRVGRANKDSQENPPDLEFNGMGIIKEHAEVLVLFLSIYAHMHTHTHTHTHVQMCAFVSGYWWICISLHFLPTLCVFGGLPHLCPVNVPEVGVCGVDSESP